MKKPATPATPTKLIDLTKEQIEEQITQMQANVKEAEIQMRIGLAFDRGKISVLQQIAAELPPTKL